MQRNRYKVPRDKRLYLRRHKGIIILLLMEVLAVTGTRVKERAGARAEDSVLAGGVLMNNP